MISHIDLRLNICISLLVDYLKASAKVTLDNKSILQVNGHRIKYSRGSIKNATLDVCDMTLFQINNS